MFEKLNPEKTNSGGPRRASILSPTFPARAEYEAAARAHLHFTWHQVLLQDKYMRWRLPVKCFFSALDSIIVL